jgi:hypothetical protein
MKMRHFLALVAGAMPVWIGGCAGDTARFGTTYDRRLPEIKSVALRANAIQVQSLHSGGVLENRPEIADAARVWVLAELEQRIAAKGYEVHAEHAPEIAPSPEVARSPDAATADEAELTRAVCLVDAVHQSIFEHHYLYGKAREFDYAVGPAAKRLHDAPCDAILCVYLQASVPTEGRQALQVTAAVVGVLVRGIPFRVTGSQADLAIMLIDGRSGDVLWYDRLIAETDVRKQRGQHKLVERIAEHLLEPRKK